MAQFDWNEFSKELDIADDAEREVLEKFFAREKNQKPAFRQADYSRRMNELTAAKTEMEEAVAAKEAALTRQAELLADWKKSNEGALEAERRKAAAAEKKIARIAEDYGIDPDSVEVPEPQKPKEKVPAVDLSGYVKADDMTRGLEALVDIQTDLLEVKEDYQELVGKPMRDVKGFIQEFAKAKQKEQGLTLTGFADRKFEFSRIREEKRETALRAKIREELETEYQKRASEARLPYATPRREGQGSPLFRDSRPAPGKAQKGRGREAVLKHLNEQGRS